MGERSKTIWVRFLTGGLIRLNGTKLLKFNALLLQSSRVDFKLFPGLIQLFWKMWNSIPERFGEVQVVLISFLCKENVQFFKYQAAAIQKNMNEMQSRQVRITQCFQTARLFKQLYAVEKMKKKMLLLLICPNATDTEKYLLLYIWNTKTLYFKEKTAFEHVPNYF